MWKTFSPSRHAQAELAEVLRREAREPGCRGSLPEEVNYPRASQSPRRAAASCFASASCLSEGPRPIEIVTNPPVISPWTTGALFTSRSITIATRRFELTFVSAAKRSPSARVDALGFAPFEEHPLEDLRRRARLPAYGSVRFERR